MTLYQMDNFIIDIIEGDGFEKKYIVSHKDNKIFAVEFTRYSVASYQITNDFINLTDSMLFNFNENSTPVLNKNSDHWTNEFLDFISSTMSLIPLDAHLVVCPYFSIWNDGFEVVTTATYNTITKEITDIETSHFSSDNKGNKLTRFIDHYILYGDNLTGRSKLFLKEYSDGTMKVELQKNSGKI